MTTVRVAHLDLDHSLGEQLRTLSTTRHDLLRILLRANARPVAWIQVANDVQSLRAGDLLEAAAERAAPLLWPALARPELASTEEEMPPVDVVVCTRRRPRDLARCLEALAAQSYDTYRVIVVDNTSGDEATEQIARSAGATYVVEPRPGLDHARNCGLRVATAPIVAYVDDDVIAAPSWLRGVAGGFFAEDVDCVTGFVAPAELQTGAQLLFEDVYGGMGKGFAARVVSYRGRRPRYVPHDLGVGCNMAFRRSALEAIGGFDPALDTGTPTGGAGDLDAFQRILERGGALAYRPDAFVSHRHRRTESGLRRQLFDNGRGYASFYCTALLRATGAERIRVLVAASRWYAGWLLRRVLRKLVRREKLPLRLILAELAGGTAGPVYFLRSRLRARVAPRSSRGSADALDGVAETI